MYRIVDELKDVLGEELKEKTSEPRYNCQVEWEKDEAVIIIIMYCSHLLSWRFETIEANPEDLEDEYFSLSRSCAKMLEEGQNAIKLNANCVSSLEIINSFLDIAKKKLLQDELAILRKPSTQRELVHEHTPPFDHEQELLSL